MKNSGQILLHSRTHDQVRISKTQRRHVLCSIQIGLALRVCTRKILTYTRTVGCAICCSHKRGRALVTYSRCHLRRTSTYDGAPVFEHAKSICRRQCAAELAAQPTSAGVRQSARLITICRCLRICPCVSTLIQDATHSASAVLQGTRRTSM